MNDHRKLPWASDDMEAHVKKVFPIEINPEEFAAKDGAGWLNFTFNDYRFADEALNNWIHAVGKIIRDPERLSEVQHKYLNKNELAEMKKYIADDLEEEDEG